MQYGAKKTLKHAREGKDRLLQDAVKEGVDMSARERELAAAM